MKMEDLPSEEIVAATFSKSEFCKIIFHIVGGSQWLKFVTLGRFFTLPLYPPTHYVIIRHIMIFMLRGSLIFIIIADTHPSLIAHARRSVSIQTMSADSRSRKRKHCECGFELTGLSTYQQAEHKRSKRHRRFEDSASCSRMENFFTKSAAPPSFARRRSKHHK